MRRVVKISAACLMGLTMLLAAGCDKLKSRDHINKGIDAYKNARYNEAVEHFKADVEAGTYPNDQESYHLPKETKVELEALLRRKQLKAYAR